MKRRTCPMIASVALIAALASTATGVSAADYIIRFSHGMPETMESDQQAYAMVFKEIVEAGSKGAIEVRVLGANKAGNERQQLEKVQNGINQMANVSEGLHPAFFKPGLVLGMPFLFGSSAVVWGGDGRLVRREIQRGLSRCDGNALPQPFRERIPEPLQQRASGQSAG